MSRCPSSNFAPSPSTLARLVRDSRTLCRRCGRRFTLLANRNNERKRERSQRTRSTEGPGKSAALGRPTIASASDVAMTSTYTHVGGEPMEWRLKGRQQERPESLRQSLELVACPFNLSRHGAHMRGVLPRVYEPSVP
eukprot:scaffold2248_cov261-Pinguiococcus_pyrenoidosus.AAC.1